MVFFGDHQMEVIRQLGNPNKHYYKDDSLFLNYLELGFDIMLGTDYLVKKIILHTNFPNDPFFCFHSRCFYELNVQHTPIKEVKTQIEEETKDDLTQNLANLFATNTSKRNSNGRIKDFNLNSSLPEDTGLSKITPMTKFSRVKELLGEELEKDQKEVFYVRNYSSGFKTHYHAFKSLIFEVMVDSDLVASVTLFKA